MSIRNYLEQNIDLDFSQEKILTILDNYQKNLQTRTLFELFFNLPNFEILPTPSFYILLKSNSKISV